MATFETNLVAYQPPQDPTGVNTQNALYSIVPPIVIDEQIQLASLQSSMRTDVINLEQKLQAQLKDKQARPTGLCPVRSELLLQTFNELIRQAYIEQCERGLLLARTRDDSLKTIAAYQTLYIDALEANQRLEYEYAEVLNQQTSRVEELELVNERMKHELAEIQAKLTKTEQNEIMRRGLDEKKYAEEQVFLQRQKAQLQSIWDNRNNQ